MMRPSECPAAPLRRLATSLAAAAMLALGACAAPQPGDRAWFAELERDLVDAGRMKADRLARDVPVPPEDLAEHFRRTAFGEEFVLKNGRTAAPPPADQGRLRRWEMDVPYHLSGRIRAEDREQVAELAATLSAATGRAIAPVGQGETARLELQILNSSDRNVLAAAFRGDRADSPLAELFLAWAGAPRWPCASEIYFQRDGHPEAYRIAFAVIYVRDELDGLSRRACLEEEMAQSLGLARDDGSVRPSIFNDDEEYALLTDHDERLIRILYDPRLEPGMDQSEAMPIVRRIAAGLAERP